MCLFLKEIAKNLDAIQGNLNKLKSKLGTTDKDYHICEINTHIERVRYHLLQININKEHNEINSDKEMTKEENIVRNSCEISAEIIEKKLDVPNIGINFRDKKIRKASSWKYLAKWESILEEQWNNQNKNKGEYDYTGINLIVPKRKQSIRRKKQTTSSTKEDFLDDVPIRKFNSIDCMLDRDSYTDNMLYNLDKKKCVSENDLIHESLDSHYIDIYNSNYLLSLKDLERIGNLGEISTVEKNKDVEKEISKSSHDIKTTNKNSSHKPKIVGVTYKLRL